MATRTNLNAERYLTHLVYIKTLAHLSTSLGMQVNVSLGLASIGEREQAKVDAKIRLIEMTKESIDQEYRIVQAYNEYSLTSILWLPVKVYYLQYHILCLIEYFITGDSNSLSIGHAEVLQKYSERIANTEIQFTEPLLNQVFSKSIFAFVIGTGGNLTMRTSADERYKLVMKKVADDSIKNYMRIKNIKSRRRTIDKAKVERAENRLFISIFDYFYSMRIRLNYRDFEFIDGASPLEGKEFFENYYATANNMFDCLFSVAKQMRAQY